MSSLASCKESEKVYNIMSCKRLFHIVLVREGRGKWPLDFVSNKQYLIHCKNEVFASSLEVADK